MLSRKAFIVDLNISKGTAPVYLGRDNQIITLPPGYWSAARSIGIRVGF